MKKDSGGGWGRGTTNYVILLATMVGRRSKFFILNRLKPLQKLNIRRREVNVNFHQKIGVY